MFLWKSRNERTTYMMVILVYSCCVMSRQRDTNTHSYTPTHACMHIHARAHTHKIIYIHPYPEPVSVSVYQIYSPGFGHFEVLEENICSRYQLFSRWSQDHMVRNQTLLDHTVIPVPSHTFVNVFISKSELYCLLLLLFYNTNYLFYFNLELPE